MFDKIKSAFVSLSQAATHTSLSKSDVESILWDFELAMIESDVSPEVVEKLNSSLAQNLEGTKIPRSADKEEFVLTEIKKAIHSCFASTKAIDLLQLVKAKLRKNTRDSFEPFVILFLGINGTGKTTSVAKVANLLKKNGLSVVLACGDTHRAGAIEQLTEHATRLGIRAISQSYGSDPAAVAKDAELYAVAHRVDCVLIDTAGRMQTSKNLMEEMGKIVKVAKPDLKIFVGDSLAGNDALSQANEFKSYTDFDATILTKADADVKGGAALSIAFVTQRPIIYVGTGQGYDDLVPFDFEKFVESLFQK
jgi:fused signal recognition particle receptor